MSQHVVKPVFAGFQLGWTQTAGADPGFPNKGFKFTNGGIQFANYLTVNYFFLLFLQFTNENEIIFNFVSKREGGGGGGGGGGGR